jgi:hypothetical protein
VEQKFMTYIYQLETNPKLIGSYSGALEREKQCIIKCIKELQTKSNNVYYIEVGVLYGGTFALILDVFYPNITAIGIDLFEDFAPSDDNTHGGNVTQRDLLEKILKNKGFTNFHLIKGNSNIIIPQLPQMDYACTFIDGNHSYEGCLSDFDNIYKKINHGYILLHDSQQGGVYRAVMKMLTYPNIVDLGRAESITTLYKQ